MRVARRWVTGSLRWAMQASKSSVNETTADQTGGHRSDISAREGRDMA